MAEQRLKERQIELEMRDAEEREEDARENYNNLQQEVDIKTRKLKKLFSKLQNTKERFFNESKTHFEPVSFTLFNYTRCGCKI